MFKDGKLMFTARKHMFIAREHKFTGLEHKKEQKVEEKISIKKKRPTTRGSGSHKVWVRRGV